MACWIRSTAINPPIHSSTDPSLGVGLEASDAFGIQALKVQAKTDEQGNWKLTKNNARKFFSTDKDDFHDAGRNAYVAFRIWLLDCDAGWSVNERDAALCRSR